MTTYSYKCSNCDNVFDIEATIQEKEESKGEKFVCPKCQSKNIKQKFSVINFIKNVFKSDGKSNGCCSDGNICDINYKPNNKKEDKEKNCCENKNSNGGCCG